MNDAFPTNQSPNPNRTLGSICAGIGGFDLGFERAGWTTSWTIELDDVNRSVLADRFARARHRKDLRDWRSHSLSPVACITFGSPCQDISVMGAAKHDKSDRGLAGQRSGLFFDCMEIVGFFQPPWVVFENVPALLHSNGGRDFQRVLQEFAQRGYLGFFRVLNYCHSRLNLGSELLVAEEGRWDSMVERARAVSLAGVSSGLDETNAEEAYAAGNAVPPPNGTMDC